MKNYAIKCHERYKTYISNISLELACLIGLQRRKKREIVVPLIVLHENILIEVNVGES